MASSAQKTVLLLTAILLAVLAVSGLVLWLLPTTTPDSAPLFVSPAPGGPTLDTAVLQKPAYLRLDPQPIREGAVPVQPPAGVGKANPFL
jgi:hypothetical protein